MPRRRARHWWKRRGTDGTTQRCALCKIIRVTDGPWTDYYKGTIHIGVDQPLCKTFPRKEQQAC